MLDCGRKSNGLWRLLGIFPDWKRAPRSHEAYAKAAYGLRRGSHHGHVMNEQDLRRIFTEIGCIMEDCSVTALIWKRNDPYSVMDRVAKLRDAYNKIGELLDTVEANVR